MSQNSSDTEWGKEMAAEEHLSTYEGFLTATKWGVIAMVVLLIGMATFLV